MVRRTSSASAQKKLDELLDSVQRRQDTVVITSAGKPVAALVNMPLYEKMALMQADFEKSLAKLRRAYVGVDRRTARKEIDEAIRAARRK